MNRTNYAQMFSEQLKATFKEHLTKKFADLDPRAIDQFVNSIPYAKSATQIDNTFMTSLNEFTFNTQQQGLRERNTQYNGMFTDAVFSFNKIAPVVQQKFINEKLDNLKKQAEESGADPNDIQAAMAHHDKNPKSFVAFENVMNELSELSNTLDENESLIYETEEYLSAFSSESIPRTPPMYFDIAADIIGQLRMDSLSGKTSFKSEHLDAIDSPLNPPRFLGDSRDLTEEKANRILDHIEPLKQELEEALQSNQFSEEEKKLFAEVLQGLPVIESGLAYQFPNIVRSETIQSQTNSSALEAEHPVYTAQLRTLSEEANPDLLAVQPVPSAPPAPSAAPPAPPVDLGVQSVNPQTKVTWVEFEKALRKAGHASGLPTYEADKEKGLFSLVNKENAKSVNISGDPSNFKITGNDEEKIANVARIMAADLKVPLNFIMGKNHDQNLSLLKALTLPKGNNDEMIVKINVTTQQADQMRAAFSKPEDKAKLTQLNSVLAKQAELANPEPQQDIRPVR